MNNLKLIFLVIIVTWACAGPQTPEGIEREKLYDEVMTLHDEVMPYIGQMKKLKKKIQITQKELEEGQDTTILSNCYNKLVSADKGMWDWMYAQGEYDNISTVDSSILFLKKQKLVIEIVNKEIKEALICGKELTEK